MKRFAIPLMLVLIGAGTVRAQEADDLEGELWGRAPKVKREKALEMIGERVVQVLALQKKDGSFALFAKTMGNYPLGQTALAVTALQYARPHLKGELRERADGAIARGVNLIAQKKPESLTYSAGLILGVLRRQDAKRHRELIDVYARKLVAGQIDKGKHAGMWGYKLNRPDEKRNIRWGDNSNTQFAILGLHAATRAGYQVPRVVWQRVQEHYLTTQAASGGWGYTTGSTTSANMTIAGTVSLRIAEEMLTLTGDADGGGAGRPEAVDKGLRWIAGNWVGGRVGRETYGLYALERLGLLMGRANLGRFDWYNEGAYRLSVRKWTAALGTEDVAACFGVIFLAAGLDPVVVNKLERPGTRDWNRYPCDVRHLIEHVQDTRRERIQWRIITLEAPLELLKQTPILFVGGREKLTFTADETQKLKDYVASGGTILAVAGGEGKPFDASFRTWAREAFGRDLVRIEADHALYERMKTDELTPTPEVWVLPPTKEGTRPGVIYLPTDHARLWHLGGVRAKEAFAVGGGVYRYVTGLGGAK